MTSPAHIGTLSRLPLNLRGGIESVARGRHNVSWPLLNLDLLRNVLLFLFVWRWGRRAFWQLRGRGIIGSVVELYVNIRRILYGYFLRAPGVRNKVIVPPDSIIKTFSHLKGEDAGLVISQDEAGLVTNSYILKNGEWAKFFIETWMDPLYQSYNFQKAERHALEHIVQWHPTILSKLALIPQRTFASYGRNKEGNAYRDGDFVTLLVDCTVTGPTSCDKQSHFYLQQLKNKFGDASVKKLQ
ncbi:Putative alpha-1,2-galactosyltransferase C8D2.17 [Fusarium odoratissimum]|uniref:Putative alpha-1,2-galactosyltransferase C8D2.17 n=1 Tax=Fusarium oxysporum f. sp. cubense (strain race 4) TaxID=2502994 RepID=N1RB58_FUSC4|nr:Putative alpha-1,2-galactosyltransferase C8D2.17 [Fusarium odoratissimum]